MFSSLSLAKEEKKAPLGAPLSPIVLFQQCDLQQPSVQDFGIVHRYVVEECIVKTYLRGSDAFDRFPFHVITSPYTSSIPSSVSLLRLK